MMNSNSMFASITEVFAAWIDGALSCDEEIAFMDMCSSDANLQEILEANDCIDVTYEYITENGYELPEEVMRNFELPYIDSLFDDNEDTSIMTQFEPYDSTDCNDNIYENHEENALNYKEEESDNSEDASFNDLDLL